MHNMTLTRRKILRKDGLSEMIKTKEYAFVFDCDNKKLSPTNINNAWYLIRVGKAALVDKYPMTIRLNKAIDAKATDNSKFVCGIDDGSKYVGVAIVQIGANRRKAILKATIELRQDVSKLMQVRKLHRTNRRKQKRYRAARFNNRLSSTRCNRIAPSILQKRTTIIKAVKILVNLVNIHSIVLEGCGN